MKHIGILSHSFEGATLCYRTMCLEGVARLGPHLHPEITLTGVAMHHMMEAWEKDDRPTLRSMFTSDLKEQGRKLMQMLSFAVSSLRRLEQIVPAVEDLGRRHAGYGVRDQHYSTVAAALLWTLEQGLGAGFTAEVKEAWVAMYGIVTSAMQRGAAQVACAA